MEEEGLGIAWYGEELNPAGHSGKLPLNGIDWGIRNPDAEGGLTKGE